MSGFESQAAAWETLWAQAVAKTQCTRVVSPKQLLLNGPLRTQLFPFFDNIPMVVRSWIVGKYQKENLKMTL
ncbi:hypothetical protein TNCV_1616581 [Trichonephila clavipes]|nr:hypothetical protein TNCV_1616581 [Trichonephila clavipes]